MILVGKHLYLTTFHLLKLYQMGWGGGRRHMAAAHIVKLRNLQHDSPII